MLDDKKLSIKYAKHHVKGYSQLFEAFKIQEFTKPKPKQIIRGMVYHTWDGDNCSKFMGTVSCYLGSDYWLQICLPKVFWFWDFFILWPPENGLQMKQDIRMHFHNGSAYSTE